MSSSSSTSQHFAAVTSIFEESSREPSYTVYEVLMDGKVLNSQFTSKNKAFDFARNYTAETSQVYVYKTKCIKIFDADNNKQLRQNVEMLIQAAEQIDSENDPEYVPCSESEEEEVELPTLEYDLTGLKFTDYGKGYILHPTRKTTFKGVKYLNSGWWNSSQDGWFFRKQHFDELLDAGAKYITSSRVTRLSTRSNATNGQEIGPCPFSHTRDLTGFSIEPYGRGVIVRCSRSNSLYKNREPYLLGNLGWWNNNGGGWFFQNQYVHELERLGAQTIKQEPETQSSSSRRSSKKSSSTKSNRVNYVTSDTQFMEDSEPAFEKYGKGWLLPASEQYTYNDHGKYFQGGFWMPKNNGWFFRNDDKNAFQA